MAGSQLTLIIPGWMPANIDELPALAALLRRARSGSATDGLAALASAFGLVRQGDWPLAPRLAQQAGLDARAGYWLCADPIHLEAGMNGLILHRLGADGLDQEECAALADCVAEELARAWPGARLYAPTSGRWFLKRAESLALVTHPPERVFYQGLNASLPAGRDAQALMRVMSDIQMALHAHPVNQAREAAGRLPVNSVWFWGGGGFQPTRPGPDRVLGGEDWVVALAGGAWEPFPSRWPALDGQVLACAPADWPSLEAGWFRPLASRLRWGRLARLRLAFADACVELTPRDMWRRP